MGDDETWSVSDTSTDEPGLRLTRVLRFDRTPGIDQVAPTFGSVLTTSEAGLVRNWPECSDPVDGLVSN